MIDDVCDLCTRKGVMRFPRHAERQGMAPVSDDCKKQTTRNYCQAKARRKHNNLPNSQRRPHSQTLSSSFPPTAYSEQQGLKILIKSKMLFLYFVFFVFIFVFVFVYAPGPSNGGPIVDEKRR